MVDIDAKEFHTSLVCLQVGSQNSRRAVLLAAICLVGVAILAVTQTTGISAISLSDQNEFETEPVFLSENFFRSLIEDKGADTLLIKLTGMGCKLGEDKTSFFVVTALMTPYVQDLEEFRHHFVRTQRMQVD